MLTTNPYDDDHLREECGVFGIYGHPEAAAHVALGCNLLLATKLDAARRIGSVLAAAEAGSALAEAGIGAGAADGMVPFTPDPLARRLMQVPQSAAHPPPAISSSQTQGRCADTSPAPPHHCQSPASQIHADVPHFRG